MVKVDCTWHLNRDCNFRCEYCYVSKQRTLGQKGHGVETDINAFKKNNIDWNYIMMSGGEPFIYPDYIELCKKLTRLSKIGINSNMSTSNIYTFADKIDPKKVKEIHASLHIGQRPRRKWQKFADKYNYLKNKGFKVYATQVIHPTLIDQYLDATRFFEKQGVEIVPKMFEGYYKLKLYPAMYKKSVRNMMLRYCHMYNTDPPSLMYGSLDWKGKMCSAGYNFVQIQYNGDAFRCEGDRTLLGNLYRGDIKLLDKPKLCNAKICTCGFQGYKYAYGYPHIQKIPLLREYAKKTISGWIK